MLRIISPDANNLRRFKVGANLDFHTSIILASARVANNWTLLVLGVVFISRFKSERDILFILFYNYQSLTSISFQATSMLTKSKFRNFLDCQNEFWLDQHFPEPRGELSLQEQYRREAGNEVERLARTLRPFVYPDHRTVEFRRVFRTEKLFAETDIVVSDPTTGEIEIYEVKSGTKAKPEYLVDLAFQCHVAEQSGFHVRKAFLITVDSS